jgi:phosphate transport system permease protein
MKGLPLYLRIQRRNLFLDGLLKWSSLLISVIVFCVIVSILIVLYQGAALSIKTFGFTFFTSSEWNPVLKRFGGFTAIYGTVVTSFLAILIGVPIAFGISFFMTELIPKWLKTPLAITIEILAVVPSIMFGMWALFIFAPHMGINVSSWLHQALSGEFIIGHLFSGSDVGINFLTAGIILAIMIIPIVTSIMKDAFDLVPKMLKESAYGVGATTWEVVWHIVVPYTRVQLVGSILLGLGRALGETMAVTFIIGNSHTFSVSLLSPGSTIASVLANEFTEAVGELYTSALIHLGLILFLLTGFVLAIAQVLLSRVKGRSI